MTWSFSLSLWIVNAFYISDYNETEYPDPKTITVDDCGPSNLISAGYAFWIVLIPAIACVTQLPGSLFLFGRSNFYRFSPELGIADALMVVVSLGKAVSKGYAWYEGLAAVFAVRDGIGRGDLWWRGDGASDRRAAEGTAQTISIEMVEFNVARNSSELPTDDQNLFLAPKFAHTLAPLSIERVLGAALFAIAFTEALVMLASPARTEMLVACVLALSYSASYLVLEILTWSLNLFIQTKRARDIPLENLLEVFDVVYPGDNFFTFPASCLENPGKASDGTRCSWSKGITGIAASVGLMGPVLWMFILSHVWNPTKGALILIIGAGAFSACLLGKQFYLRLCLFLASRVKGSPSAMEAGSQNQSNIEIPTGPDVQHNTHGIAAFFVVWMWHRITAVNLYSAIWIAVICYYFASVFSTVENAPRKPQWLGWLGG